MHDCYRWVDVVACLPFSLAKINSNISTNLVLVSSAMSVEFPTVVKFSKDISIIKIINKR